MAESLCAYPDRRLESHPDRPRPDHRAEALEPRRLLAADPLGTEFPVNTFTRDTQREPDVAADADGDFVVVWEGYGHPLDDSEAAVFAQRYTAGGAPVGGEVRVNSTTFDMQEDPAVAISAGGRFVVAWESRNQDGPGYSVYAQRFNADGTRAGGEFRIHTTTQGDQTNAAVAMDADGDFVVAWTSQAQYLGPSHVFARRYTADGVPTGDEFRVGSAPTFGQADPLVAVDADGDFVVAWLSYGRDLPGFGLYAQRYTAAGVAAGGDFRVSPVSPQHDADLAMGAAGNFVLAWSGGGTGGAGVHARRYTAAGAAIGSDFRVSPAGSGGSPSVAAHADGGFVVTWTDQDGSGTGIAARHYTASGAADGGAFRVNTVTEGIQSGPSVAADAEGDFVIAWTGRDAQASGILGQRFGSENPAPAVGGGEFVYRRGAPHRLQFFFSQDVRASLSAADILVERLGPGPGGGPVPVFDPTYDGPAHTATFAFGVNGGPGLLQNGNYRATLLAPGVTNAAGMALRSGYVLQFFVLAGDVNRDRRVDGSDFAILAGNFGQAARTYEQGDLTGDGRIDGSDFSVLAGNFGKNVPPPVGAASTPRNLRRPDRLRSPR